MHKPASKELIDSIKINAVTFAAREAEKNGCFLTHEQYDELGEQAAGWLESRLGLVVQESDDRGILYVPGITDAQIEALGVEAAESGDDAQVRLCAQALDGDATARARCERVIRATAAQQV